MRPPWVPDDATWTPWLYQVTNPLRRALDGSLGGQERPPRPPPPLAPVDARQHALEALRDYLAEIRFRILDPPGEPRVFGLEPGRILTEYPENQDTAALFPRVVMLPGEAQYLPRGLSPIVFEHSRHRHGRDTVLVCAHEYREEFRLEVWATTRAQRHALVAGIEQMISAPLQETPGLRLRLPRYHDAVANFQLERRANVGDEDAVRRRRKSDITLSLRVDVLRLVNARTMQPVVEVRVLEPGGGAAFPPFPVPEGDLP